MNTAATKQAEVRRRVAKRVRTTSTKARESIKDACWRAVGPVACRYYARYYDHLKAETLRSTHWLGTQLYKLPADLWIYQELLHELRPALVLETGTFRGGSALYLASIMDLLDCGEVVTVELNPRENLPEHKRIEYLVGSSTAPDIVEHMRQRVAEVDGPVIVVLDSYHGRDHVLAELEAYQEFVRPGSYLIVEDTSHNGHPTKRGWGPGPWEAVDAFLAQHPEFVPDRSREKFLHSQNPRGFLRRTA